MFRKKIRINFYYCDPAGIIFYANLFKICHSVYEELIESFNLEENYWQNDEYVVPIIRTDGEFIKPVRPGDYITIQLSVSQLKEHSFELSYDWLNEKGELAAKAKTVHVFVDKKTWKKREISKELTKSFSKHLAAQ
jgi:YbgC/YbaW family acyl-CoA thioester hydrolase